MTEARTSKEASPQAIASARQACVALRKALDAARLYGKGHAARQPFFDALARLVSQHTERFGALRLVLTSTGLTFAGEPVFQTDREDATIRTPFVDHVRAIAVRPGATAAELGEFVDVWAASLVPNADEEHTFVTRCWEAEFLNVQLETEATVLADADEVAAAESFWTALGERPFIERLRAPDGASLAWLGAEVDLPVAQMLASRAPFAMATAPETRAMVGEFVEAGRLTGARAIRAVASVVAGAEPADEPRLRRMLASVIENLAKNRRFPELQAGVRECAASSDPEPAKAIARALLHPPVLAQVLSGFRDPATAEAAGSVVRAFDRADAGILLDAHAAMTEAAARRRFALAIAELQPPGEELERRITRVSPEIAQDLFLVLRVLPASEAARVRVRALAHPDASVRRTAANDLRKEDLAAWSAQIVALLSDPDEEVRRIVLNLVVRARHPQGVSAACELVRKGAVQGPELRRVLVALGAVGGSEVSLVLRQELRESKDVQVKAAAALALGQAGDEISRPLLVELAARRGTPPVLREAAEEAVRRLEARRAGAEK